MTTPPTNPAAPNRNIGLSAPDAPRFNAHVALFGALFAVSGACGLIYEVVWSQLMIRVMGGTTFAIATVLVAFMGGLGLGGYWGGRLSQTTRRPARIYGVFEIAIGVYALVLPLLLDAVVPLYRFVYPVASGQIVALTMMRFVISGLILLVPTVLMGATLPLLIEHGVRGGRGVGRSAGWMFATNTLGAFLGAAADGYLLIPLLGVSRTTWLAAGLNGVVGLTAILMATAHTPARDARTADSADSGAAVLVEPWRAQRPAAARVTLTLFALSGVAAMIYQVVWTRVLVPHLGPHTYSFTCVLCAFILGLALGAITATRWADRTRNPLYLFGCIETAVATGGLIVAVLLDAFPIAVRRIAGSLYTAPAWMLTAEFAAVMLLLIIPTFALGMIYPVAVRIVAGQANHAGRSAGRAYAANTLGAIVGSFLAGFVLIPTSSIGLLGAMLIGVAIHAACGLVMLFYSATDGIRALPALPVALCVCVLPAWAYVPPLRQVEFAQASYMVRGPDVPAQDYKILYYREGTDATVVVARRDDFKSLMINNKADGSTSIADATTQLLAGHLPMLLADQPRDVLVVGWGTGMTTGAVSLYDSVEHIDAVEISEAVISADREFADVNYAVRNDPRLHLIRQDGRNHLLLTDKRYDVIISEPSNPWVAGMAGLFTQEYYTACKNHLTDRGVFLAWMHSYTVDPEVFRSILRTVATVMPHVSLWGCRGDFMMVASNTPLDVPLAVWLERIGAPRIQADLARIGYDRPEQILAMYIGDRDLILRWTEGVPLHRDDLPRAQYSGVWAMLHPSVAEVQISQPLATIAQSPFQLLKPDPANTEQAAVIDHVQRVRKAWGLLREGLIAEREHRQKDAVQLLARAHDLWPYDDAISRELNMAYTILALSADPGDTASQHVINQLADRRPPPVPRVVRTVQPLHQSGLTDTP